MSICRAGAGGGGVLQMAAALQGPSRGRGHSWGGAGGRLLDIVPDAGGEGRFVAGCVPVRQRSPGPKVEKVSLWEDQPKGRREHARYVDRRIASFH